MKELVPIFCVTPRCFRFATHGNLCVLCHTAKVLDKISKYLAGTVTKTHDSAEGAAPVQIRRETVQYIPSTGNAEIDTVNIAVKQCEKTASVDNSADMLRKIHNKK